MSVLRTALVTIPATIALAATGVASTLPAAAAPAPAAVRTVSGAATAMPTAALSSALPTPALSSALPTPALSSALPTVSGYVLRRGDTGQAVFLWQVDLSRWLDSIHSNRRRPAEDGTFGPYTQALTKYFQQRVGLVVDGVDGPRTDAAMNRALGRTITQQPLLRQGDRGQAVRDWQRSLNIYRGDLRTPPLKLIAADGVFGPQTDAATRELQRKEGITVDGIVGPQTRLAVGTI